MTHQSRIALIALMLLAPLPARGQLISWRAVLGPTGEAVPNVYWGPEVREELGEPLYTTDTLGVRHRVPPCFLISAMGLAGITWNKDETSSRAMRTTAQGQLGFLYRAGDNLRLGMYGVAVTVPESYGALGRIEPISSFALQVGWLRRKDTHVNEAVVQVDLALVFLNDLLHGGAR